MTRSNVLLALPLIGMLAGCQPEKLMKWEDLVANERPSTPHQITTGDLETDIVDLWLPDTSGPHPVVIMVHGGCWQKSIADRTLMNYAAEDLRQRGLAVWNIEYRGVDEDGGGYPGTFLDVANAADALVTHADAFNLDTDRVTAFGHSAGGHLALWLAARENIPAESPLAGIPAIRLKGVVNSGGLADLEASAPITEADCLSDIMDKLTGDASTMRPDVFSDTSPATLLPIGIRQISVNGARDHIAPPELGEGYTAKARKSGDPASVEIVQDTGHVELISPGTTAFEIEAAYLIEMLGAE